MKLRKHQREIDVTLRCPFLVLLHSPNCRQNLSSYKIKLPQFFIENLKNYLFKNINTNLCVIRAKKHTTLRPYLTWVWNTVFPFLYHNSSEYHVYALSAVFKNTNWTDMGERIYGFISITHLTVVLENFISS